jgi:hypothetical protein
VARPPARDDGRQRAEASRERQPPGRLPRAHGSGHATTDKPSGARLAIVAFALRGGALPIRPARNSARAPILLPPGAPKVQSLSVPVR